MTPKKEVFLLIKRAGRGVVVSELVTELLSLPIYTFASISAGYLSNNAFSLQKGGFSPHPVSRRMDILPCGQKRVE